MNKALKETKNNIKELELPEAALASLGEFDTGLNRQVVVANRDGGRGKKQIVSDKKFPNLENGVSPFLFQNSSGGDSTISLKTAISLCQKTYYNVPIFRNTIDLMSEFSLADVYLSGGNEQSRKFFELWMKKINLWSVQDQFYRELYRSGNVFLYSINADISRDNMMKINEMFGSSLKGEGESIPIRYILLNPADICVLSSSSFTNSNYYKILNEYEVQSVLNPKTDEDREILEKIPELKNLKSDKKTRSLSVQAVKILLDKERLVSCFYKKQSYEPFSVPMGFAVLEDIDRKLEMKKIDQAIARTMQQAVLLITMGDEKIGLPSPKNIQAMKGLFENQSVGKVLVSDYTTKASFIIPDIGNLLDPKKYEILDRDIRSGLNNILFGEDKFSNASIKVKVFFARLRYGRDKFLKEFLNPEIERIGKILGFKSVPVAKLNDLELEDNAVMSRVYSQLASIGVLTPEEVIDALQTGRMPTPEESEESQKKLKEMREKGMYLPFSSASQKPEDKDNKKSEQEDFDSPLKNQENVGRPAGSGGEKQVKPRPPRALASEFDLEDVGNGEYYSCKKMKEVLACLTRLEKNIESSLKEKFSIKRLTKVQKELIESVVEMVCKRETISDWENKEVLAAYMGGEKLTEESNNQESEIESLAEKHGLNPYSASILYHSKFNKEEEN